MENDYEYLNSNGTLNCPFCNHANIVISSISKEEFDLSNTKKAYLFLVTCSGCGKTSAHFSEYPLSYNHYTYSRSSKFDLSDLDEDELGIDLDSMELNDLFYAHIPSSTFVLSDDIPESIRKELSGAEQSHAQNLLTGGSASLRKAIYLLLKDKKSIITRENAKTDYQQSLKQLKEKVAGVDPELIDFLADLKDFTDDQVHEDSWDGFDGKTLKYCVEVLKQVLYEVYVKPASRKRQKARLNELGVKFKNSKNQPNSAS